MTHVFDLDNTLVFTDRANRSAYNRALQAEGLSPLSHGGRITREAVRSAYPDLDEARMRRIIDAKQAAFPFEETAVNEPLLRHAKALGRERCLIWSSADAARAQALIRYHGLDAYFFGFFSSKKRDIPRELEEMVLRFSLDLRELCIYEDTDRHIEVLRGMGIRAEDAKVWSAGSAAAATPL